MGDGRGESGRARAPARASVGRRDEDPARRSRPRLLQRAAEVSATCQWSGSRHRSRQASCSRPAVAVVTEEDLFGSRRHTRAAPRLSRATVSVADELEPETSRCTDPRRRRYGGPPRWRRRARLPRPRVRGDNDRLYVPTEQVGMVAKYLGGDAPRLHRLGVPTGRARPRASSAPSRTWPASSSGSTPRGWRSPVTPSRRHAVAARARGRVPARGDARPGQRDRRGEGRHGEAGPDGPPDLRGRRLRQDGDRRPRRLQGRDGGQAGRRARADDAARGAALRHVRRALRPVPREGGDAARFLSPHSRRRSSPTSRPAEPTW